MIGSSGHPLAVLGRALQQVLEAELDRLDGKEAAEAVDRRLRKFREVVVAVPDHTGPNDAGDLES